MADETVKVTTELVVDSAAYKKGLEDAIASTKSFVTSVNKLQKTILANTKAQAAAAEATRRKTAADKQAAKASREGAGSARAEDRAKAKLAKTERSLATVRAEAEKVQARALRIATRKLTQDELTIVTARKLNTAIRAQQISRRASAFVIAKGIQLTEKELRQAGILNQALLTEARARDRVAIAEAARSTDVQTLNAEARALDEINAKLAERADRLVRAREGLGPTPKQKQEQEVAAQEAAEIRRRAFDKVAGKEFTTQSQLAKLERERIAIKAAGENKAILRKNAELAAQRAITASAQKEANIKAGVIGAGVGQPPGRGKGLGAAAAANNNFNKSLKTTQSLANRLSFTFRRLFGILAAFTIARRLVQAFTDSIRAAINFNARLEQARLGIASIFLATGQVTTALGETVSGAEGLAIASQEAKKQIEQLKLEAVRTAATFDELTNAFQTAVAPGLRAGLDLDEIRELTVRISQAAAAIGVPQRQLAEEIRSLLQGTIRVRDTRIAVALGITNEDIRRAKELGQLGSFLEKRFKAFAEAGKEAEKTFIVAFSNLKDALLQLSGAAGFGFFEELKDLVLDIRDAIVTIDEATDEITFNEDALVTARVFFDILQDATQEARLLASSLDTTELQAIGSAIAQAASVAFSSIRIAVDILISGLSVAANILNIAFTIIGRLGDKIAEVFGGGPLQEFVEVFLKWVVGLKLGAVAVIALGASLVKLNALLVLPFINASVGLFKWVSGMRLAAVATTSALFSMTAFGAALGPIVGTLALGAASGVAMAAAFNAITKSAPDEKLVESFKLLRGHLEALEKIARGEGLTIKETFIEFALRDDFPKTLKETEDQLERFKKKFEELGIDPDNFDTESLKDKFLREATNISKEFGEIISEKFNLALDAVTKSGNPIKDLFEESTAAITAGTQELAEQQKLLEGLAISARALDASLSLTKDTLDASSAVTQQRTELMQAQLEINEASKQIIADRTVQERLLEDVLKKQRDIQAKTNEFSKKELEALDFARDARLTSQKLAKKEQIILNKRLLLTQQIEQTEAGLAKDTLDAKRQLLGLELERVRTTLADKEKKAKTELDALLEKEKRKTQEIVDLTLEKLTLQAQETGAFNAIIGFTKQLLGIEDARNRTAQLRIRTIATTETHALQLQARQLQLQVTAEQSLFEARQRFTLDPRREALVITRNEIALEKDKLALIRQQGDATIAGINAQLAGDIDDKTRTALEAQRLATNKRITLEIVSQGQRIRELNRELEELTLQEDRPIFAGILEFVEVFSTTALDKVTNTVQLMGSIFQGMTDTLATNIAAAFDPTQGARDNKERWGRFFLQIAQQAIAMLIKIAIAQAILVPWLNSFAIGSAATAPISFSDQGHAAREGGVIPKHAQASPAHFSKKAQAFREGGQPNAQDTTPIWAQPGEWMMRLSAVRKYGLGVMSSINAGLIDPTALRALAGTKKFANNMKSRKVPAFATGGFIGDSLQQLAAQGPPPGSETSSGEPSMGLLVASEDLMDQLLAQGEPGLLRFMESNAPIISSILDR